jgi:FkbH-like protein
MVIWDLDDTFWRGTLTEGSITVDPQHINIIVTLAGRGIVSSICSKNNYIQVQRMLEQYGIWDFIVFPHIDFTAKGIAINSIIEQANLRPDNVLFIDDNRLNLEEAKYFVPNLMTAHPHDILPTLLDQPNARGKDDPDFVRLLQYKQLQKKVSDQVRSQLKQEDFLRQCDIRVGIDINVEEHLDRIVELINRSNQLNFTKIRLETDHARDSFKRLLREYGVHVGVVRVTDKYGDYGIVGFFMTRRTFSDYSLEHFVFSCRVMNMGIEQYVYEVLGKPRCRIVPPVANGLESFEKVDWISALESAVGVLTGVSDQKLLLLGTCDLLQVATYCSTNRVEYVNHELNGEMAGYGDVGFILGNREALKASAILPKLPCWQAETALDFDKNAKDSETVVVSLFEALRGCYALLEDDVLIRVLPRHLFRPRAEMPYLERCTFLDLKDEQKVTLMGRALDRIVRLSPQAKNRFLLGASTKAIFDPSGRRPRYNAWAADYCARNLGFQFIPIDDLISEKDVISPDGHFTREAYYKIASRLIGVRRDSATYTDVGECPMQNDHDAWRDITATAEILSLVEGGFMKKDQLLSLSSIIS